MIDYVKKVRFTTSSWNQRQMGEVDVFKKRKESLDRVKATWKGIIERYQKLGPLEQGDIVDISTGEIIKDVGHLRSLTQQNQIWRDEVDQHNTADVLLIPANSANSLHSGSSIQHKNLMFIRLPSSRFKRLIGSRNTGDDNLSVSQPSESESDVDIKMEGYYYIHGMDSSSLNDPLNMLSKHADLTTPSKIRRVRKAINASRNRKPSERTRLHQLVKKAPKLEAPQIRSQKQQRQRKSTSKRLNYFSNMYDPIIID